MAKNDFFVAGRWRNKDTIEEVVSLIRGAGKSAHCFLEDTHGLDEASVKSSNTETLAQDDPLIRRIFDDDMQGLRDSEVFLLVLPAGLAAHMELGVAYGMGMKCYAVGKLEKTETLYCMFEKVFTDMNELKTWLEASHG